MLTSTYNGNFNDEPQISDIWLAIKWLDLFVCLFVCLFIWWCLTPLSLGIRILCLISSTQQPVIGEQTLSKNAFKARMRWYLDCNCKIIMYLLWRLFYKPVVSSKIDIYVFLLKTPILEKTRWVITCSMYAFISNILNMNMKIWEIN